MEPEQLDALIGQVAAKATLLHAITNLLLSKSPGLAPELEQLVEAGALTEKQSLSGPQRQAYDAHLAEIRTLWR